MTFVRDGITLLGLDPIRRAGRTADAVDVKDRTLYFCPSILYGYGIDRLLASLDAKAPNSAVLCIEADSELYDLTMQHIDPVLMQNKKLHITNICSAEQLCTLVNKLWGAMAFHRIEMIKFTGGFQLNGELYESLCHALRREIATDLGNVMTLAKLGRLYIRNFFCNLPLVSEFPSMECLSFGSAPILVLGAGPSLDETLDALDPCYAKAENRPFGIVCVDTCLGSLRERNIEPDLVVILESQHWNLRDFIGCRGWNIAAAIDLSALPSSTRQLGGNGYLFFTPWTNLRIFNRLSKAKLLPLTIPPLGSVGLTAVEISRRLTKGKIICAGLDFSFTADKYHARGSPGHRAGINIQTRFRRILNTIVFDKSSVGAVSKKGEAVYTSPSLKHYRNLFIQEFAGDLRLYDIIDSGLSLGIKTLSLKNAIEMLENKEFCREQTKNNGLVRQPGWLSNNSNVFCGKMNNSMEKAIIFLNNEKKQLEELKNILTGEITADQKRLNVLIDECDYLWAHFPDCSQSRPLNLESDSALSFLKRVRLEIEPVLKLLIDK